MQFIPNKYTNNTQETVLFWMRRDLRLEDNHALYMAIMSQSKVRIIFIFDSNILSKLPNNDDARVTFIYRRIKELKENLRQLGSELYTFVGKPSEIFEVLIQKWNIKGVYTNEDYEPYALLRDSEVHETLKENGIGFYGFKDHVIFSKDEILKKDSSPYIVFTPYKKQWLLKYDKTPIGSFEYNIEDYNKQISTSDDQDMVPLEQLGFEYSSIEIPSNSIPRKIIASYDQTRDYPALNGTSHLGVHLRFGTVSIRRLVKEAVLLNDIYLSELIWREFYSQILAHFPFVVHRSFRKKYDNIKWINNEQDFEKWSLGQTGYPLVDAGMRQLNSTGYMHNRVRMVVASFLTKHLLIDWRLGEQYFADRLIDFELSSNNGGWQWAAGSGTDAAPYFRIFNPTSQLKKFDPEYKYVRQWIPELDSLSYVQPMIDHKFARQRCLQEYKRALQ